MTDIKDFNQVMDDLARTEAARKIMDRYGLNENLLFNYWHLKVYGLPEMAIAIRLGIHFSTACRYRDQLGILAAEQLSDFLFLRTYMLTKLERRGLYSA